MTQLPKNIQRKLDKLAYLENAGVDNWEWYDQALTAWYEENELEEMAESIFENICQIISSGIYEPAGTGCGYGVRDAETQEAIDYISRKLKELKK